MTAASYTVHLDAFEGPLDLLLHLVRSNELDIYDLPIAAVTDQYLAYLEMFEELNLDVASEYLVMAASLMYMKSRLLLPVEPEEDEAEEDPVHDLVRQLAEYQRYREAAEALRDRALLDRDVFRRVPAAAEEYLDGDRVPPVKAELGDLFEALRRVLQAAAARRPHTLTTEEFRVEDCVRSAIGKLRAAERLRFEELFPADAQRGFVVATFVGLLELLKMGVVDAEQNGPREPIFLTLIDRNVDERIFELIGTYGVGDALPVSQAAE